MPTSATEKTLKNNKATQWLQKKHIDSITVATVAQPVLDF